MAQVSYVVLDANETRRNEIYRTLAPQRSVIPIGSLSDLGSVWPDAAWFLVHDDQDLLAELQRAFSRRRCFHPIVVYSESVEPGRVVSAIYGGAVNYVSWPSDIATIEKANASVAAMARQRCEQAAARLLARGSLAKLTGRECEVIRAMRRGLTNKQIARELEISPRTVEIHRSNALTKLGARNSLDAVRILVEAEDGLDGDRDAA